MSAHTPGPWRVETCLDNRGARNGLYLIQTANRRTTLAKVDRHYAGTYAETEANTRLISAAPELLAALKATMDLWGSNAPHDFDVCEDTTCTCVRQQARAAIAKAEGR